MGVAGFIVNRSVFGSEGQLAGWAGRVLATLDDWRVRLGSAAPAAFAVFYVVWVVACLPALIITLAAGFLFGLVWGTVVVSVGATAGASLAFLIARYFARSTVRGWIARRGRLRRLDDLVARRGAYVVALTRLVPIFPFNIQNYGYGLTGVGFWSYALMSWLFMLPGTVMYVSIGAAIRAGVHEGGVPWTHAGIAAGFVVCVSAATAAARRALARVEGRRDAGGDGRKDRA
jgi:uncharacterized membrane protein YdjX (TVP38/TMEM64 family)